MVLAADRTSTPVESGDRRSGLPLAIAVGIIYSAVGVGFGVLAGSAVSSGWQAAWRLGAWAVCGGVYSVHLAYEHFVWRERSRPVALHVATAVAVGAFGLAIAATIHRVGFTASGAPFRLYVLALLAWPMITAVPAFILALILSTALARIRSER